MRDRLGSPRRRLYEPEAHRTRLWLAPAVDPGCSRGKGLLFCKPDKLEVPKVS